MNTDKAKTILEAAIGLKRHEWAKIAHAVERKFDAASNRIALTREDAESAEKLLRLEAGEITVP